MILNSNQIQEIIPHRQPFMLIDKIIDLNPGENAVGIKNVTANEDFFRGHFPKEHIMPGVLIVEALAQTGAVVILTVDEYKGKLVYFAGIEKCTFRGKVIPGDTLRLEAKIIRKKGRIGIAEGLAYVEEKLVCQAIVKFAISS